MSNGKLGRHSNVSKQRAEQEGERVRGEVETQTHAELAAAAPEVTAGASVTPPPAHTPTTATAKFTPAAGEISPLKGALILLIAIPLVILALYVSMNGLTSAPRQSAPAAPSPAARTEAPSSQASPATPPKATTDARVYTSEELAQLTRDPARFGSTNQGESSVNARTPVMTWTWGESLDTQIRLRHLTGDPTAWELSLLNDAYTLPSLAPQRQQLFVLNDVLSKVVITAYRITSGPFMNHYAHDITYTDGGRGLKVITEAFAVTSGNGSEFEPGGHAQMLSYPLHGYLAHRDAFCSLSEVTCP